MATKHNKKITFEEALSKLESIIESMEEGNTPLSDLVTNFEEGAKLIKICKEELKSAELKINKLDLDNNTSVKINLD